MNKGIFISGVISLGVVVGGGIFAYDEFVLDKLYVEATKDQPHVLRLFECKKIINCVSFEGDNAQPQVKVASRLDGGAGYSNRELCEAVGEEELSRREKKYGRSPLTRRYYECVATSLAKPRKPLEDLLRKKFG